jgi:hypothetical protein
MPPSRLTRLRISKLNMSSSGFGDGVFALGAHQLLGVDARKALDRRRRHQLVEQRDGVGE